MSGRVFIEHQVRTVESLEGLWDLFVPAKGSTLNPLRLAGARHFLLPVPGVWETLIGLENYRGQAVARRRFSTPSSSYARLVFRGVSHTARVYLDGCLVGQHHNAFTPFAVDLPALKAGSHELLVHISNEHGALSALHVPNDYYNYGGLNRPVELQYLRGSSYIRFVHFTPECPNPAAGREARWSAGVQAEIVNLGPAVRTALDVKVAGATLAFPQRTLRPGVTVLSGRMAFARVTPWDWLNPRLYSLTAHLMQDGAIADDLIDRVGFRTVKTAGRKILLNGRPTFLFGFNRHEDTALHGCAQTFDVIHHDIALMRDLGVNAVRTSHYPNDQRFLDLCDEHGIMVWEESHARGLDDARMAHPCFRDQCRQCIAEMIGWHHNHPSIVLWGILNECASHTPAGRKHYAEQFRQIRSLDRSRPTTFASFRHGKDLCQDLPDVCGWNWYHNWYAQIPVADANRDALRVLDATPAGRKPIIASEFGGEGLYGFRDPNRRAKWSEDRQADILDECLSVYLDHPRFSGAFIWQFGDVRVDESIATTRARCMNNKGVVDEYRRPKLGYEIVKRYFHAMRRQLGGTLRQQTRIPARATRVAEPPET